MSNIYQQGSESKSLSSGDSISHSSEEKINFCNNVVDDFDLYDLVISEDSDVIHQKESVLSGTLGNRNRLLKDFISYMPSSWIISSFSSGLVSVKTALCCYYEYGKRKSSANRGFKFTNNMARKFALSSKAKCDGLHKLEELGLIEVDWRSGKSPIVFVLIPESEYK